MSDESRRTSSTDTGAAATPERPTADREQAPNTLLNGLIGGVVAVVLGFIPFSTVLGGGVAGYLEGGTYNDGAKVGGIAGLIAFLPIVAVFAVVLLFIPVAGAVDPGPQIALWAILLFVLAISAVYAVGLSIVGGVLGVYLNEEL